MKMVRPIFLFMVLAGILAGANYGAGQGFSPVQLNEKDSGRTIEIRAGDRVDLALFENAATGFRWEVAMINETIIKQARDPEFKPNSGAIGAGGKKTFHFVMVAPGEADLKLIYRRPWEANVPPALTFRVRIKVSR